MISKQNILLTFAILAILSMFLLIIFGDKGLADLNQLKKGKEGLVRKNTLLMQENLSLYRSVERLRYDLNFIEYTARQDLGLIGKNEIIFKIESDMNGKYPLSVINYRLPMFEMQLRDRKDE